jgi:hypothetical protein
MGDVAAGVHLHGLRDHLVAVCHSIRRKKGLQALVGGLRRRLIYGRTNMAPGPP